ncbi:MAG: hypothetical protein Q3M24_07105 [Candidatus Electrothrix aestuarii]|uniref:Uncharacterized protein n=1 Tax=Candidatus Electrothrix aestuarii TaxID=3062594 RepID=A0AAU8M030_9BACT
MAKVTHIVTNTTFQWFIGLLVAIAGVVIGVLALMQGGESRQKDPLHQAEYTVPLKDPVMQNQPTVTPPDTQALPQNYSLIEHQPLFIRDASTNLSIRFQNIEGEEFVSLNISPTGKKSSVRPVLEGYTEDFTSSEGVFDVQVLDIDYTNQKVTVQVSRKI